MPSSCCICGTRRGRDDVSFFRFPKKNYVSPELKNLALKRQELWLKIIGKLHLKRDLKNELLDSQINHIRVCSRHFVSGRSAALQEVDSPDWVPSLNLVKLKRKLKKPQSKTKRVNTTNLKEFRRLKKKTKLLKPYLEYILNEPVNGTISEGKHKICPRTLMKIRSELQTRIQNKRKVKIASKNLKKSTTVQRVKSLEEIVVEVFPCTDDEHNYAQIPEADPELQSRGREKEIKEQLIEDISEKSKEVPTYASELAGLDFAVITETEKGIPSEVGECPYAVDFASSTIERKNTESTESQTTTNADIIQSYELIINDLKAKIQGLEQKLEKQCSDVENLKGDDEKTNYYTGLSKYETLERLYISVSPYLPRPPSEVTKFHILLITLMKLRLNLPFKYLGYKFNLSTKTITKYFFDSVVVLSNKLKIVPYNFNMGTSDKNARWAYVDNVESGDIILPDRGYMSERKNEETFIAPLVRQKFVILNNLQAMAHEIRNGESILGNVIKSCCALATLNPSSSF